MSINAKAPTLTEWLEQQKAQGLKVTEHTGPEPKKPKGKK